MSNADELRALSEEAEEHFYDDVWLKGGRKYRKRKHRNG